MDEIVRVILEAVISILAILVARYAIPYIKAITESEKYSDLIDIVNVAVKAAEQTIRENGQGKAKKAQVIAFVLNWLSERNIYVTEDELDRLIEYAVWQMKKEVSA